MFNSGMTVETLRDCLAATDPVNLLGMRLLKTCPQTGLYPTDLPRETLKEAVSEIVDYTGRCTAAARRLSHLAPIPLTTLPILEFGL
ncbi:MAG: hypothetical protein K8L99_07700 [Anaerolineae bacterium]|nr:hypothetical protein [Anaerolineae bacterium]